MATNFNFGAKKEAAPKDAGPAFRWMVRLCGLAVIGGLFLPFLEKMNIMDLAQGFSEGADAMGGWGDFFGAYFTAGSTGGLVAKIIYLVPFILFPLIGLSMVLRGKYAGGPFTLILLYLIAAFVLFRMYGEDAGAASNNFFALTGPGFWVSTGGLFLPFVGMFFLDKSI